MAKNLHVQHKVLRQEFFSCFQLCFDIIYIQLLFLVRLRWSFSTSTLLPVKLRVPEPRARKVACRTRRLHQPTTLPHRPASLHRQRPNCWSKVCHRLPASAARGQASGGRRLLEAKPTWTMSQNRWVLNLTKTPVVPAAHTVKYATGSKVCAYVAMQQVSLFVLITCLLIISSKRNARWAPGLLANRMKHSDCARSESCQAGVTPLHWGGCIFTELRVDFGDGHDQRRGHLSARSNSLLGILLILNPDGQMPINWMHCACTLDMHCMCQCITCKSHI